MDALQISFREMEPSPAVEARIRERVERLMELEDRLISCHVVVTAPHRRQRQGKLYGIKINLVTPRGRVVVSHDGPRDHAHEDVYVAIRDAFDAATRRLEDHVRRRRGDVKAAAAPQLRGVVARLFPDHGFITTDDALEVYFHKNSVVANGFERLQTGDPVQLVIVENESRQGPQATTVKPRRGRQRSATAQGQATR